MSKPQHNNNKTLKANDGKQTIEAQHYVAGPLPSADEMTIYQQVSPDLVTSIVTMAEKEADFRHNYEMQALKTNTELANKHLSERKLGQMIGGAVSALCMATCGYLGYLGMETAASIVGGTTVIGLVTVFVTGQRMPKDE